MRWLILLGIIFIYFYGESQVFDDFSDGDFKNSPAWLGDTAYFKVVDFQLQSQGPNTADILHLSTPYNLTDSAEFVFRIKLGFNPSSSNFVRIYLSSDSSDLEGSLNGYFIQFGEASTSADSLDFFRQNGKTTTKLITSAFGCMTSASLNEVFIKVIRNGKGEWEIYADCDNSGVMKEVDKVVDQSIQIGGYFGMYCKYSTASRNDKYFLDDVTIRHPEKDTVAVWIANFVITGKRSIEIEFSEVVDTASVVKTQNYSLNQSGGIEKAVIEDYGRTVRLKLSDNLENPSLNTLSVSSVSDQSGNTIKDTVLEFSLFQAEAFDVLITELMPDPAPPFGLPNVEYIELFNRSQWPVNLEGWKLKDPSGLVELPEYLLGAGDYVTLVIEDSAAHFSSFGNVLGLRDWISLNNDKDFLQLRSDSNEVIHQLSYSRDWYRSKSMDDGGFSLEMIDVRNPCADAENWKASIGELGGTPSQENSVSGENLDLINPVLVRSKYYDSLTIGLVFNEQIDSSATLFLPSNFTVEENEVLKVLFATEKRKELLIHLKNPLQINKIYEVKVKGVFDCVGLETLVHNKTRTGRPVEAFEHDFVINEILFNPFSGGDDFIEIYNRSDKIIEMNNYYIFEEDPLTSGILEYTQLNVGSFLLFPGDFLVITENGSSIMENYDVVDPYQIMEIEDLPNFDDRESIVYFIKIASAAVDRLHYSNSWHSLLLHDENGVSLERISYEDSTQNPFNWSSSSSYYGYATPTYQNSQFSTTPHSDLEINLEHRIFSPDGDGQDDVLLFRINRSGYGGYANVRIYSDEGIVVRYLVKNAWLGDNSLFSWDGTDDTGSGTRTGIYLLHVQWLDPSEKTVHHKFEEIVVGGRVR